MTDKSSQQALRESLSALVDDQASELEVRRVLRASEDDAEIRDTWTRYQLARSAMRGDLESANYIDLSASIRDAIDEEESYAMPATDAKPKLGWTQRLGRFAIAASVAGVVVLTAQVSQTPEGVEVAGTELSPDAIPSVALPAGYGAPNLSARTVSSHKRMEPSQSSQFLPQVAMPQTSVQSQSAAVNNSRQPSREVQAHLHRVMEIHAGHAALNSGKGMLPYARVPVLVGEPVQEQ
ncbi:anti-sigma factor MucA [Maricurvus nonylphenolicus]|uniref:sigma-E factor negative regulatory protein n=1 Tax=Maricurvus nonylphenolicus TaxID=1008307 RepID=UPI0036F24EE3